MHDLFHHIQPLKHKCILWDCCYTAAASTVYYHRVVNVFCVGNTFNLLPDRKTKSLLTANVMSHKNETKHTVYLALIQMHYLRSLLLWTDFCFLLIVSAMAISICLDFEMFLLEHWYIFIKYYSIMTFSIVSTSTFTRLTNLCPPIPYS